LGFGHALSLSAAAFVARLRRMRRKAAVFSPVSNYTVNHHSASLELLGLRREGEKVKGEGGRAISKLNLYSARNLPI